MADRPTKSELLRAVAGFLTDELLPDLEGVRRFHARVAANALGIVAREIELEPEQLPGRHARLCALLEASSDAPSDPAALSEAIERMEAELCERIRAGEADASGWRQRLLEHLKADVSERLSVSNPGYR